MRRRFSRARVRGTREQTMWERFSLPLNTSAAIATPNAVAVSSPQFDEANIVDSRWTLRTIHLQVSYQYGAAVRVPNASMLAVYGLFIGEAANVDPQNPQRADMLDIWAVQAQLPVGDLSTVPFLTAPVVHRHVRAQRKMEALDFLWWGVSANTLGVPIDTTPIFRAYGQFSLLWQRTRR